MLDLYKLGIFQAVAAEGSIICAAENLHLSQPAVSQHIKELEARLGARLFDRGRRGVTLTAAGATLLDYARCILRMVVEAENAVVNVSQVAEGRLRVGATPEVGTYLLPEFIQAFHERFPRLNISLHTGDTRQIARQVAAGELEIGFAEGEPVSADEVNSLFLQEIESRLIVGPSHPWWERPTIPVEDLSGQPFVAQGRHSADRLWLDRHLTRYDVSVDVVAEFDNLEAIKRAATSGLGMAVVPACAVHYEEQTGLLRALGLENARFHRTLALVWSRSQPLGPVTRAFLTHLTDRYPQLSRLVSQEDQVFVLPDPTQPGPFNCAGQASDR